MEFSRSETGIDAHRSELEKVRDRLGQVRALKEDEIDEEWPSVAGLARSVGLDRTNWAPTTPRRVAMQK